MGLLIPSANPNCSVSCPFSFFTRYASYTPNKTSIPVINSAGCQSTARYLHVYLINVCMASAWKLVHETESNVCTVRYITDQSRRLRVWKLSVACASALSSVFPWRRHRSRPKSRERPAFRLETECPMCQQLGRRMGSEQDPEQGLQQ